jgi:hypothetical protein
MFWLGLIIGMMIGGTLGLIVAGLCASAAEQDERMGMK